MKRIIIYNGNIPMTKAQLDEKTGIATTEKIFNCKYPGGTNQAKVKLVNIQGHNVYMVDEYL